MNSKRAPRHHRAPPRAAVLVAVVACLGVIASLLATIATMTVHDSAQVRRRQLLDQADWLVEAGAEKAARELATRADYLGESIVLTVAPDDQPAAIQITIHRIQPRQYIADIAVEYPAGSITAMQMAKQFEIVLP